MVVFLWYKRVVMVHWESLVSISLFHIDDINLLNMQTYFKIVIYFVSLVLIRLSVGIFSINSC